MQLEISSFAESKLSYRSSGELGASDPSSLSAQQYYSVQCTGLEARLVDCTWTIRTVRARKKDAVVLCKEGEVMDVQFAKSSTHCTLMINLSSSVIASLCFLSCL